MNAIRILLILCCTWMLMGCTTSAPQTGADTGADAHEHDEALPELSAMELAEGERLQVVATTNIVADVVARVGGNAIDLMALMPVGADPHSFEPAPSDIVALNEAGVIFVNGLHLEESLDPIFDSLDGDAAIVSVNVGVETLAFGDEEAHNGEVYEDEEEHEHGDADPHTWFSIDAVNQWVTNIEEVLSTLDPTNAESYAANAQAYRGELSALQSELDQLVETLPVDQRRLVTDHDSLGYLARAFGFEVVGSVLPSLSTLASPSAGELAQLQDQIQDEGVAAIFVGTTVNTDLAGQIAADVDVAVVPIYTGSLSDADGPASSYLALMRYDLTTIVEALRP